MLQMDQILSLFGNKKFYMKKNLAAAYLSWLERRVSDPKVAGSMSKLGITLLCAWERHLTLVS